MDIVGDRKFVEVPGGKTHDLPPLLVKTVPEVKRLDKMMGMAAEIIEQEDMVPTLAAPIAGTDDLLERRKMDLALNLVDQYMGFSRTGIGAIPCWSGSANVRSRLEPAWNCATCCATTFGLTPDAAVS
jgi:hypothetical protein